MHDLVQISCISFYEAQEASTGWPEESNTVVTVINVTILHLHQLRHCIAQCVYVCMCTCVFVFV